MSALSGRGGCCMGMIGNCGGASVNCGGDCVPGSSSRASACGVDVVEVDSEVGTACGVEDVEVDSEVGTASLSAESVVTSSFMEFSLESTFPVPGLGLSVVSRFKARRLRSSGAYIQSAQEFVICIKIYTQ